MTTIELAMRIAKTSARIWFRSMFEGTVYESMNVTTVTGRDRYAGDRHSSRTDRPLA